MPLTNLYFYFVILCIVVIYYIIPNKTRWGLLLISSLMLYATFAGKHALTMMISSVMASYAGARGVVYLKKQKNYLGAKITFWVAAGIIVGFLGWYNYLNFVIENINYIVGKTGSGFGIVLIRAASPLGISFYSLSLISYLVDVYWEIQKEEKNIGRVILYACYFPIVTTGPILKYSQFQEQIGREKIFTYENMCFSLQRILWGIFKKSVIADYFSVIVNEIFQNYSSYSGGIVLGGIYLSAIQLYLNFSASIDIVLGISQMFGIELPENFERPFSSCTITELFRRWHISLGHWLKDYIYYPLMKASFIQMQKDRIGRKFGKKAGKRTSVFLAMLIMWTLNGVWHGAKWKYIIGVGLLLWLIMLMEEIFEPYRLKIISRYQINEKSKIYLAFRRISTYTKFSIMMIFFNADGVIHGIRIIKHMVTHLFSKPELAFLYNVGFSKERIIVILLEFFVYLCVAYIAARTDVRKWIAGKKIWFRWGIYYFIILSIILFSANGTDIMEGFIYAQF